MKALAIVNPVSGSQSLAGALAQLNERLRAAAWRLEVQVTKGPGDATGIARQADADTRAVVAVGGDGTVREIVEGLRQNQDPKPIVIMPSGTENLVARELGMRGDPEWIARALVDGQILESDMGVVNGRHFLVVTGMGFDAEVVEGLTRSRKGHITQLDYFWPLWRVWWSHRFPVLTVRVDGEPVFEGQGLVFVGVTRQYAQNLGILPLARRDDGLLDLCVYPCRTRWGMLPHAARTVLRRHPHARAVVYRQGRVIEVTSQDRVPLEADGDLAGTLPAAFSLLPRAAKFLVPRATPE